MPNGWDEVAGGFPAMTGNVPFLMKDAVLLAASFYLLKQDVVRAMRSSTCAGTTSHTIKYLARTMDALGLLTEDLEYHVLRVAMVMTFAFFGYTKWHQYGAQAMIPFISNSPSFLGCIQPSGCAEPPASSVRQSGPSWLSCMRDSGTKGSDCLGPSVQPSPSLRP